MKTQGLDDAFNVESSIVSAEKNDIIKKPDRLTKGDIQKDYEYTRGNLYSIIEKGQEAINGILELAQESEMPRAYEVAGQLIGQVAQTVDKLQDLQKKLKDLKEVPNKANTNIKNALFVGSTNELQKMLNRKKEDEIIEGETGQPSQDNIRDK